MNTIYLVLAVVLMVVASLLLWWGRRKRLAAGIPPGRVVYSDTGAMREVEKPLYDAQLNLTGRPDYLVKRQGYWVPVEVKSGRTPSIPYESHVLQLAAYCILVERATGKRPPYGILKYRNRAYEIKYTLQLENDLLNLLVEMRQQMRRGEANRSHDLAARCTRCGYRTKCDQAI
ncbi:MAG TPA: CRISPR-associated protein Cas4 [Levilinea sp.]|nr:CRISPR-associated protein Cas4 [Levilinea sp.]